MSSTLVDLQYRSQFPMAGRLNPHQYPPHDHHNITYHPVYSVIVGEDGNGCKDSPRVKPLSESQHSPTNSIPPTNLDMHALPLNYARAQETHLRRKTPHGILPTGYDGDNVEASERPPTSKRRTVRSSTISTPDTNAMANLELSPKIHLNQLASLNAPSMLPRSRDPSGCTINAASLHKERPPAMLPWRLNAGIEDVQQPETRTRSHRSNPWATNHVQTSAHTRGKFTQQPYTNTPCSLQIVANTDLIIQEGTSTSAKANLRSCPRQTAYWIGPSIDSVGGTRYLASAEAGQYEDINGRRNRFSPKQICTRLFDNNVSGTGALKHDTDAVDIATTLRQHSLQNVGPCLSPNFSSLVSAFPILTDSDQLNDPTVALKLGHRLFSLLVSTAEYAKQRRSRNTPQCSRTKLAVVPDVSQASSNIHALPPTHNQAPSDLRGTQSQLNQQASWHKTGSTIAPFSQDSLDYNSVQWELVHNAKLDRHQFLTPNIYSINTNHTGSAHAPQPGVSSPTSWTGDGLACLEQDLVTAGKAALEALTKHCRASNAMWIDGMSLAGSLCQIFGDFQGCMHWCLRVLQLDRSNVEAMSALAATMSSLGNWTDAENYWRTALKIQPGFLMAVEHLVSLLCTENRREEALRLIDNTCGTVEVPGRHKYLASRKLQYRSTTSMTTTSTVYPPGTAGIEQLLRLLYSKGNLLYSSQDNRNAAIAFENVVLIAVQDCLTLTDLITLILRQTSIISECQVAQGNSQFHMYEPVLLTPERALATAKLCFPPYGDLPGLSSIRNPTSRKAAKSIVSNSLLSLAKIFQDSVASAAMTCSRVRIPYQVGDILALYYLSFALQPSPSTANNVGILLASFQQTIHHPQQSIQLSTLQGVTPGSGVALAFLYYQYGLELDPRHAHLYTNLGSLLKDLGQLSAAVNMYQKAVDCDHSFDIALANLANALKDQGKTGDAIGYYRKAVQINPEFYEAICGLAYALNSICNWTGRGGVTLCNGRFDRWHVDDIGALIDSRTATIRSSGWIQRVIEIVDMQLLEGENWGRGTLGSDSSINEFVFQLLRHETTNPKYKELARLLKAAVKSWSGQKNEGARLVRLVERATRSTTWRWYCDRHVNQSEQPCNAYTRPQLPPGLSSLSAPTVLPFHTFTLPVTARHVRMISQRNGLRMSTPTLSAPWLPRTVFPPPPPPRPYLNVGYISSDFNNHPLAHLMQSVFGFHDRKRVRAICYATTPSDNSIHRHKIEAEAPLFYDASTWPVERLVQQILIDQVHILVNLNGYTRGARNEVFAARPAPIQMSFMGFAGTLGAEWCDYILADDTAIPATTLRPCRNNVGFEDLIEAEIKSADDNDWVYGENIIYTKESFFCCDHRQSGSLPQERHLVWQEELRRRWRMRKELFPTLSDNAIILGNFNQLYKIDPTTFRTWLRILSRVPNAVLWLLRFPDLGEQQLRSTAQAWAAQDVASRIVFTDVAPKSVHIARACIIDLFLDTPECNAHTTAADCLWSGTPLLTLPRYPWKMASRMAAGILGGALNRSTTDGREAWEELVASSEEEYEETAVRLSQSLRYTEGGHGQAVGRLIELRKLVWENRWRPGGLFDTRNWVHDIEDAYEEAWRRWVAGEGGDIRLADLQCA